MGTCKSKCHLIHRQPRLRKEWRWMMKRGKVHVWFTVKKGELLHVCQLKYMYLICFLIYLIICFQNGRYSWFYTLKLSQKQFGLGFLLIEFNLFTSDYSCSIIILDGKGLICTVYTVGWNMQKAKKGKTKDKFKAHYVEAWWPHC